MDEFVRGNDLYIQKDVVFVWVCGGESNKGGYVADWRT